MSDPKEQQHEPDELEPEGDLELDQRNAEQIVGGDLTIKFSPEYTRNAPPTGPPPPPPTSP